MATVIKSANFPEVQWVGDAHRDGTSHHPKKWTLHRFNCFDGEGITIGRKHQYVYLAAYDGQRYYETSNPKGISTIDCFKFLVNVTKANPLGINVIYGGNYDAEMMLRDVSVPALIDLHHKGQCRWQGWWIRRIPRKEFVIKHIATGATCKLWDVIGFYQTSFINAIKQWLDVVDPTITKGKASRQEFNLSELPFIMEYCKRELVLFEALMQRLWDCLNAVGIKLSRWDGAGAAAQAVLGSRHMERHKGTEEQQEAHYHEAQCAYAGGRFELIRPGDFRQPIYNYDINSAYPYAMSLLPPFNGLRECSKTDCEYTQYDLLKIDYEGEWDWEITPFHPYFHRTKTYNVYYPLQTIGWHWGIEWLSCGRQGKVVAHLHWDDNGQRPFAWVNDYYQYRYDLKTAGDKAEKAVKLVINSLYGKLVQQRGWRPETDKKPRFHQLYWGGWITAFTRSMMFQAMSQHPLAVIAAETDGLFTTKECDLVIGKGLGEWGLTKYQSITYVQSGMYFATDEDGNEITRYRGLDQGELTRQMVLDAWEAGSTSVVANSTRFRMLGTSLQGSRLNKWRQWVTDVKEVQLRPTGKRRLYDPGAIAARVGLEGINRTREREGLGPPWTEIPLHLQPLQWGVNRSHLTLPTSGKKEESHPYNVLWRDMADKVDYWQEWENGEESWMSET